MTASPDVRRAVARIEAIDRLRGLIMVLMALDHTSAFLSGYPRRGEFWAVTFPEYDDVLPFVIRAVTHLCAPGFFLLMGASLALADRRVEGVPAGVGRRGIVLVGLQLTVVNVAWLIGAARGGGVPPGAPGDVWLYFGVLYGLGGAMILTGPLLRRPAWALAQLAVALLVGVAAAMPDIDDGTTPQPIAALLAYIPGATGPVMVRYPVLPWLPLTLVGVVIGRAWAADGPPRWLLPAGLAAVAGFVVLRVIDGFGTLRPATPGIIGFFNLVKYPPSIAFVLLFGGLNVVLLALLARMRGPRILATFGRATLFFYVAHLYLYAVVGRLLPDLGFVGVLAVWPAGLAVLWPLCRWWSAVKARQPAESWLRLL